MFRAIRGALVYLVVLGVAVVFMLTRFFVDELGAHHARHDLVFLAFGAAGILAVRLPINQIWLRFEHRPYIKAASELEKALREFSQHQHIGYDYRSLIDHDLSARCGDTPGETNVYLLDTAEKHFELRTLDVGRVLYMNNAGYELATLDVVSDITKRVIAATTKKRMQTVELLTVVPE